MVGTRRCTGYGCDLCRNLVHELAELAPDILVVSGLAYGIDVNAHRAALNEGMDTVGVLAHGLDTIYPAAHRGLAAKMLEQGGLLTEYMSGTNPDKGNFVRRNRIVAGMCDATVVVESAAKGGSLITATIAHSYGRDVFAFPGRAYDPYSAGCHKLIQTGKAGLICHADDLLQALGWDNPGKKDKPRQLDIDFGLADEEKLIVNVLKEQDEVQINQLVVATGMDYSHVTSLLFELEMKGIIKVLGGARYRLIQR